MLKGSSTTAMKKVIGLMLVFLLSLTVFYASGVQPMKVKAADNYDIGVFYFSNWNPELSPHMLTNSQALYGRSDWFAGIKDTLTQPGLWNYGPIADREPLLGWYDDRQQTILDQHILQAASRGIDHFAYYYYWKEVGGGERPGQNINKFNSSPYKDLLKYYIYFVADGAWPQSDWNNLIVPKFISHMKNSSYKKTADGRPVIGFFGDMKSRLGGTDAGVKNAMNYLRTQCQNNGLGNPLLLYNAHENLSTYTNGQGYDGFLHLNFAGIGITPGTPGDFNNYNNAWPGFVTRYNGYKLLPSAASHFDPRPWRGINYPNSMPDYVYTDPTPMKFRTTMQNLKTYMDAHPSSTGNIATIYAWNELGEGGTIEPTTLNGYGYLNAIQEVFGLDNSPYKTKVQQLGLTDLAQNLRVEAVPDDYSVSSGQSFKIKVRTKNYYSSSITSGTVSLNSSGWTITASSNTSLSGLAAGAIKDTEFTVTAGSGSAWAKVPMTVNVSYTVSGQNLNQSVSTFVVPTYSSSSTLLYDGFNSGTTGSAPSGWTLNTSGGTVTVQDVPSASEKSMRLQKTSANSNYSAASQKFTVQSSGVVTYDTWIMVPETSSRKHIFARTYDSAKIATNVSFTDGYIKVNDSTNVQTFTANQWYHIVVNMNMGTKTMELYIDNVLKGTYAFQDNTVANVGEILFAITPSCTGNMYVSDITVKK